MHRKKNTHKILFTHKSRTKGKGVAATQIEDKLYINFEQGSGENREAYFGVGMKSDSCKIFWPMFKEEKSSTRRFIACEISSRKVLPEKLIGLERCKWPIFYQDHPDYAYPNKMIFRFFVEPKIELQSDPLSGINLPNTIDKLIKAGWPEVGRTYCFLYPGGAGARIEQYKYLPGEENKTRISAENVPQWWPEGPSSWYIHGHQGGWAGPVTSFYRRIDTINSFWSYFFCSLDQLSTQLHSTPHNSIE